MKRIFGILVLGCLAACSPSQPKQGRKVAEPVANQTQVEQSAVAQETPPAAVATTPSK
jgi:hypothetical protein